MRIGEEAIAVRAMRDLHVIFDRMAKLVPGGGTPRGPRIDMINRVSFRPLGTEVAIDVDERQVGQIGLRSSSS